MVACEIATDPGGEAARIIGNDGIRRDGRPEMMHQYLLVDIARMRARRCRSRFGKPPIAGCAVLPNPRLHDTRVGVFPLSRLDQLRQELMGIRQDRRDTREGPAESLYMAQHMDDRCVLPEGLVTEGR